MIRCRRVRLFLLSFMFIVFVANSTAYASLTHQTVITFNIEPTIEVISWPSAHLELTQGVVPGQPVVFEPLSMTVRSNAPWYVNVRTDSKDGTFRIYNPSTESYLTGTPEVGPIEIGLSSDGPWSVLSSNSHEIIANEATGENPEVVEFFLRVTPSFDDLPLVETRVYRVELIYTAGVSF